MTPDLVTGVVGWLYSRQVPDINFVSGGGGGRGREEMRLCYVQDYKTRAATAMILLGIN